MSLPSGRYARLAALLRRFIEADQSMATASSIEACVETEFADDERFEVLALAAAKYQPGGGHDLVDVVGMTTACAEALLELESREGA